MINIKTGMFNGLKFLKELYLENNRIIDIESGSFLNLIQCSTLSLWGNKLTHLKQGMSWDYLHYHEITCIETGSFAELPSLTNLYLYNNSLSTLQPDIFLIPPRSNISLYLGGNPLVCNSDLCWLKQAEKKWITIENRIHEKPPCNGIPWDNVVMNCKVIGMYMNYLLF